MVLKRGAVAKRPAILEARPLVPDDLRVLRESRVPTNTIKTLREKHHRIARLDAAGLPVNEILELTGIGYQTLYRFRLDPAYQELRAQYRGRVEEAHIRQVDDLATTAIRNMKRMEVMIEEHLEAADAGEAEKPPLPILAKLTADRMDRFGYGKRTTQTNVNIGMAALIENAIVQSGRSPPMLEAKPVNGSSSQPASQAPPRAIFNRRGL